MSEDKGTKILEDDLEDDTAVGAETAIEDDTEKAEETTTADDTGELEDVETTDEPEADASEPTGEPEAASDTPKRRIQWSPSGRVRAAARVGAGARPGRRLPQMAGQLGPQQ